jgi:Domain of unknown function (DUF4833)
MNVSTSRCTPELTLIFRVAIIKKREVSLKILMVILLAVILSFVSWSPFAVSWNKSDHLFFIERSKNKNYVQYDVRLTKDDDLPASSPVTAYWVLENGQQQELTLIERKCAYGIDSQEELEQNKFRVFLVALKDREIIVEKMNGSFGAVVSINGEQSILERVYIESQERWTSLPKVLYIDLFGWTKERGFPVRERIKPK